MRTVIEEFNGRIIDTAGDGLFTAFESPRAALSAAVKSQRILDSHKWIEGKKVKVRMGLHAGEATKTADGYTGLDIHHAARIMAAAHGGQVLISDAIRALLGQDIPPEITLKDLGKHRFKDFPEPEKIYQLVITELPSDFPPIRTPGNYRNNLPLQLTELIGRDEELKTLKSLVLNDSTRLITVTGPGGVGKTHLTLSVLESLLYEFEDGVFVVLLAPVKDYNTVPFALANALGIKNHSFPSLTEAIIEFLADKKLVLYLDNFEHVISSAGFIAEILSKCPSLKILISSRTAVNIRGEHEFAVDTLPVPVHGSNINLQSISSYPAIELFEKRAKSAKPDFKINDRNASAVAEICAKLDGLPLAIELAAARIKLFTPEAMLARIASRLDLLKGKSLDAPERHRTLRQTIEWSYNLLTDEEKMLFKILSVFVGGCTLDAVESVCSNVQETQADKSDLLESLIDKNLVRRNDIDSDEPRFIMLQTIRDYSMERLEETEIYESACNCHSQYYLDLAQRAEPELRGNESGKWLDAIEKEMHNFRSCINRAIEKSNAETAIKLSSHLRTFWYYRGNMSEAYEFMKKTMSINGVRDYSSDYAKVLNAAGNFAANQSKYSESILLLEQSLKIFREIGDRENTADVLTHLGRLFMFSYAYEEAEHYLQESLNISKESGYLKGIALSHYNLAQLFDAKSDYTSALNNLKEAARIRNSMGDTFGIASINLYSANIHCQLGNYADSEKMLEQAMDKMGKLGDVGFRHDALSILAQLNHSKGLFPEAVANELAVIKLCEDINNFWDLAIRYNHIAHYYHDLGNFTQSESYFAQALNLFRKQRNLAGITETLTYLTNLSIDLDKYEEAKTYLKESLLILKRGFDKYNIARATESAAELMCNENEFESAARLVGYADKLRKEMKVPRVVCENKRYGLIMKSIGGEKYAHAFESGRKMDYEESIASALSIM